MDSSAVSGRHQLRPKRFAFTLIELLVVVAIIALLISILLPSLAKARAQARGTLCSSRIAQLGKTILMYSDDFTETPPFTGIGWEDLQPASKPDKNLSSTSGAPSDISTRSRWDWAVSETWLTKNPDLMWNGTIAEQDWDQYGIGVKTGMLYPYARFENLYRCPDFERQAGAVQHQFNYTRTILGRKWIMGQYSQGGKEPDYWGSSAFGAAGPVMRLSQIYAPSKLSMFIDEWWKRHVGSAYEEHVPPRAASGGGGWSAMDCLHFFLLDEVARSHGSAKRNEWPMLGNPNLTPPLDTQQIQQGFQSYYDGHAEMVRDIWADKSEINQMQLIIGANDLFTWLSGYTFAQRGKVIIGAPL
jgi:prepilin-type N-terminal cleavage/methylation domain-containing protein